MSLQIKVLMLFGPTGVGKTKLLCHLFPGNAEVVSADSMQVYRFMDIGTAKPSRELQHKIPHHLIDCITPDTQFTLGDFVHEGDSAVRSIVAKGKIPVVSGGTAFYLRHFIYGLPGTPPGNREIRAELKEELLKKGPEMMYRRLLLCDPKTAERIQPGDTYRVLRALEVWNSTGRSLSSFQQSPIRRKEYDFLLIGLFRPREELYERIDERVDLMFEDGLKEEIKKLISLGYGEKDPGMQAIGYKDFFYMIRTGCVSMPMLKERIKRQSRRYAKRQQTFFKKISGVYWFSPEDISGIHAVIDGFFKIN